MWTYNAILKPSPLSVHTGVRRCEYLNNHAPLHFTVLPAAFVAVTYFVNANVEC